MALERAEHEPTTGRTWFELWRAFRRPWRLLVNLVERIQEDDILTSAAALAYYFFFAIFPLLLFVLALASLLRVPGLEQWLLENARQSLPPDAYNLVDGTVRSLLERPRSGLLSIGAALALWTASSAFGAVMNALNRAYRVRDERPWWRVRLQAIGLTVVLSVLMIVAFVLTVFGGPLVELVGRAFGPAAASVTAAVRWTITIAAVMLVAAAIYYACPAVERDWQWIRPGAVLFALGFLGSSAVFSYYVSNFSSYDATYGSLGAVIVLLLWMYLLGFFLLLGGELNALLEGRRGRPQTAEYGSRVDDGDCGTPPARSRESARA
jgi:membrane protein